MRHLRTIINSDGSASTHIIIKCTLEDISAATYLRVEDVAFAMHESGMLSRRVRIRDQEQASRGVSRSPEEVGYMDAEEETEDIIVVSREMVEKVASERNVKKMCMELQYVLL